MRDHLQVLLKVLKQAPQKAIDKTLAFCLKNQNINAHEFEQVLQLYWDEFSPGQNEQEIKLLNKDSLEKANQKPQLSNIEDYQNIINS